MTQRIIGKGVVTGRAAETLRKALESPKYDPKKVKRFKEAIEFWGEVRNENKA